MSDFILRRWEVAVQGYPDYAVALAPTRGAALADAWRCDAFCHLTFGQFLKIARCTLSRYRPARFGDAITVEGKSAFYIDHNRQYVTIAWPGGKFPLSAHPLDVLPEEYRPRCYRTQETVSPTNETRQQEGQELSPSDARGGEDA